MSGLCMRTKFHINWDGHRDCAWNRAHVRMDTSGFLACVHIFPDFCVRKSFSKKSTKVSVMAPGH